MPKPVELDGEFWLTADGHAMDADGDAGVDMPNHEMCVLQEIASDFLAQLQELEHAEISEKRRPKWQGVVEAVQEHCEQDGGPDVCALKESLYGWADAANKADWLTAEEVDDVVATLTEAADLDAEAMEILFGDGEAEESRQYGRKNLGWTRVLNANLDTYGLTEKKLERIADGLYEAYDRDVMLALFRIDDHKTGRIYEDVPYRVFSNGWLSELDKYVRPGVNLNRLNQQAGLS